MTAINSKNNMTSKTKTQAYIAVASLIIAMIIISFIFYMAMRLIYGQQIDPNAYCLYENEYPYTELCLEQKKHERMNDLLQMAKLWNKLHPD